MNYAFLYTRFSSPTQAFLIHRSFLLDPTYNFML
jgi:hypothetical protein